MKKGKQILDTSYLSIASELSATQIAQFLEDFRNTAGLKDEKTQMISIRIPANVLRAFKLKASEKGISYQRQMVELMRKWVSG